MHDYAHLTYYLLRNNLCTLGCHSILSGVWHWHNILRLDQGALATPVTCNLRTPADLGLTTFVAIGIILVIGIWYWATHTYFVFIYLFYKYTIEHVHHPSFCSNQIIFCPQSSNHPSEAVSALSLLIGSLMFAKSWHKSRARVQSPGPAGQTCGLVALRLWWWLHRQQSFTVGLWTQNTRDRLEPWCHARAKHSGLVNVWPFLCLLFFLSCLQYILKLNLPVRTKNAILNPQSIDHISPPLGLNPRNLIKL